VYDTIRPVLPSFVAAPNAMSPLQSTVFAALMSLLLPASSSFLTAALGVDAEAPEPPENRK